MSAADREARKESTVYQVRIPAKAGPGDLLDGLTWTVWRVIAQTRGPDCLGQHRWAELRGLLQKTLAGRLVRYGACGKLAQCRAAPRKVFWPGDVLRKPSSEIHLLEVRGAVDRLLEEVGAVVERHFAKALGLALRERRAWRIDLSHQLRSELSDRLYFSPECAGCIARKGFRERRLWKHP